MWSLRNYYQRTSVGGYYNHDENRLEWVQRDGGTYLVPASRDTKISGIRHWEQAFRAYATIYCGANPHRAKEIWQYIGVINTAAASYVWDNVYNYDITFRHLMAFNPHRSWSVTYNQMWNLSMKEPLPKISQSETSNGGQGGHNYNPNNGNKSAGPKRYKRSEYCWNFNRGVKCKFGNKCKFIERCSYCDSGAHGIYACSKRKKQGEASNNAAAPQ